VFPNRSQFITFTLLRARMSIYGLEGQFSAINFNNLTIGFMFNMVLCAGYLLAGFRCLLTYGLLHDYASRELS
jgi:hypothetical protein